MNLAEGTVSNGALNVGGFELPLSELGADAPAACLHRHPRHPSRAL